MKHRNKHRNFWDEPGPRCLVEFLTNAEGENHDAAVYDTKLEFDKTRPWAVQYVACCAMKKAAGIVPEPMGKRAVDGLDCPMPTDGSVVPIDVVTENQKVREAHDARKMREAEAANAEAPDLSSDACTTYVPDSQAYAEAVIYALRSSASGESSFRQRRS